MTVLILNAEWHIDMWKHLIEVGCLLIVCGSYGTLHNSISRLLYDIELSLLDFLCLI